MPLEERWGLGEGGEWQGNEKKKDRIRNGKEERNNNKWETRTARV